MAQQTINVPAVERNPPLNVDTFAGSGDSWKTFLTKQQQMNTELYAQSGGTVRINTALNTVSNGTLLGAALVGGVVTRGGAQSGTPFSDATDSAANIYAAFASPTSFPVSMETVILNTTNAVMTITGGSGVTPSGNMVIPPGAYGRFLLSMSSAAAATFKAVGEGRLGALPAAAFSTAALSAGTLAAGAITGANFVVLQNTGATPGAQTVRTAAQMLADIPGAQAGDCFRFRIVNTGAGTLTLTADAGPTVTLTGTATVAQNVFRDYTLTFNSATTATIQSVGSGTSP